MSNSVIISNNMGMKMPATITVDTTTITTTCPFCKKQQEITAPTEDVLRWRNGTMIQSALPTLSADQREALMTGICSTCFPSEEE